MDAKVKCYCCNNFGKQKKSSMNFELKVSFSVSTLLITDHFIL